MGLDWNPLNKPKPGSEAEFAALLAEVVSPEIEEDDPRLARFEAISITPYETLAVPRVGASEAADRWAREQHRQREEQERARPPRKPSLWRRLLGRPPAPEPPRPSLEEWMQSLQGFHV